MRDIRRGALERTLSTGEKPAQPETIVSRHLYCAYPESLFEIEFIDACP